jgi:hypothetical protein
MQEIFLSSPMILIFVLYVAALLLIALAPGTSDPEGRAAPVARRPPPSGGDLSLPAPRLMGWKGYRELLPVRELKASCAAEYAARFSAAIERARKRRDGTRDDRRPEEGAT